GGEAAGEVASGIARDHVARALKVFPEGLPLANVRIAVQEALFDANAEIRRQAETNPGWRGMGTTASVVKIWKSPQGERKAVIGQVGDSRVYILRAAGELEPVTIDNFRSDSPESEAGMHCEAQRFLSTVTSEDDFRKDEERAWFRSRNIIAESLGSEKIHPNLHVVDIKPGDRLLLTSDGIHDNLTDGEIADLLKTGSGDAARELARAAQERSRVGRSVSIRAKPDDMSAIVVDVSAVEQPPAPAGPPAPEPAPPPPAPPTPEAALAQARQTLVATEKQLKEKRKDPEAKTAYEAAKTEYETKRAEHVGASVERMLGERERLVEQEIAANPRKAGAIEQVWRKAGDVSLIPKSWRESFDSTDFGKTRPGQIFIRSLNMRTAISLSLLGVGFGVGFGSIVGIGTLIARSGIGMAGTYFGSQALMEGLAQKRRFTVDQKKLRDIESFDLTDTSAAAVEQRDTNHDFLGWKLAGLEAASLLAGKLPGDSPEYERLKHLYFNYVRAEASISPLESATERLSRLNGWLDKVTSSNEKHYREATRARKVVAGVLAAMFPVARILTLTGAELDALEPGAKTISPAPRGGGSVSTVEDATRPPRPAAAPVVEAPRPAAPAEAVAAPAPRAPEAVPAGSDSSSVRLGPETAAAVNEVVAAKAAATAEALSKVESALGPTMAIEQGGNVWRSALRLVENGEMSRPQFEKAWANSFVEIEGQGKVPISKVGLVHAGDIVRFNREAGVFEIIPKSSIPVGSDKDLFAAYEKLGKEPPEWLKKSVGAPLKPADVIDVRPGGAAVDIEPPEGARTDTVLDAPAATSEPGGHPGEPTAGGKEAPSSPEALAKIQKSLEHFNSSNLADQEEMMRALARRAGADPMAKTLLDQLQESPAYIENQQAFVRLINRLIDFDVYAKIRGMSLRDVLGEGAKADIAVQEARAGGGAIDLNPTARAMRRLAQLVQDVNPDEAARGMSVDTFLKIAPKRLLELIPDLKF
ncbi:MAG: serine/threonine-protein phosphatase, partial [bacterium]|nr:serine/threonine-protein phosphatase [bacterium]